jgi:hypothetical protein
MPHKTELYPVDAVCRQAIATFAEHLTRWTTLRPRLVAGEAADVVFEGDPEGTSLLVQWEREAPPADDLFEEWETPIEEDCQSDPWDEEAGEEDPDRGAINFYAATMAALARNPEAARTLLRKLT